MFPVPGPISSTTSVGRSAACKLPTQLSLLKLYKHITHKTNIKTSHFQNPPGIHVYNFYEGCSKTRTIAVSDSYPHHCAL